MYRIKERMTEAGCTGLQDYRMNRIKEWMTGAGFAGLKRR